jgi:hypothetical protein
MMTCARFASTLAGSLLLAAVAVGCGGSASHPGDHDGSIGTGGRLGSGGSGSGGNGSGGAIDGGSGSGGFSWRSVGETFLRGYEEAAR